ncbi:dipicolinate synthase subunit DpsA [Paenibacillus tengchongensis]|uniref:dipicolinate synthase subunit DpsA n=1 Tax=Paenibacillus tengchongensis TaxID=2608684 RepID=UPI00124CC59A|nr:dipicolinate synthase subunit DpsA [Paenibacillus tengchongensis]
MSLLNGKKAVVIGGDLRQLEVIRMLLEQQAEVSLAGYDELAQVPEGAVKVQLEQGPLAQADAIILPVAGTGNDGSVESSFTSESLMLTEELVAALPKHAIIFTGIAKSYLREICERYTLALVEILAREDVAIYNSIPTAEGAVMIAIQHTDVMLHGSRCIVLGLGRVGTTLARTLKALGADVAVCVHKPDAYARAYEMGLQPFYPPDLPQQAEQAGILFNTVPAPVITRDVISRLPRQALIIDLASHPGGTDFAYAKAQGIQALPALGLPGIVAPRSAGRIIGNVIVEMLDALS